MGNSNMFRIVGLCFLFRFLTTLDSSPSLNCDDCSIVDPRDPGRSQAVLDQSWIGSLGKAGMQECHHKVHLSVLSHDMLKHESIKANAPVVVTYCEYGKIP